MEPTSAMLLTFGIAILLVSWILLLITAWRDDYAWGLFATLLPPVAYIYGLFRLEKAGQPLLVAAVGCVFIILAF
ncbi:MAG: hypothetical protein V2I24_13110 [Halieaceae bacterium]|jgi:uncharacterized membrane protein YhhN|nr:hypothetical protein [Halieaceae bacterium]